MLGAIAGLERTEAQWREAISEVGLELVKTFTYNSQNYESILDVRLPRQK
jgi:hypothetical protein